MRGRRDRKKAAVIKKEVEHNRWLASFLKDGKPSTPATKSPANKSTKSIKESNNVLPTTTVAEDSTFSIKTSGKESSEAFSANLLEEKIRKLEMIEKSIRDREQAIIERSRESEERAKAMEKALQLLEQRAKEDEAERLARQELMMMAAGPISHRSQYASIGPKSSRSVINTSRSRSGKHQSQPQTARMPDAPPTARSARGGASIPPDALRRSQDGHEWVRLWDPDEAWYYWYNEITQEAQWEEAGQEEGGDGYYSDSGYESTGAMTDYSTDQYESGGEFGESELEDDWQEYWDEQAQAKYWYNNATVSKSCN